MTVFSISDESYEKLREILESEFKKPVSLAEAKEAGRGFINTYKLLAGDREILGVSRQMEKPESNFPTEVKKRKKTK